MEKTILHESLGGGVLLLTINRLKRRNALDVNSYQQLCDAFRSADEDDLVRCVVLTGAGEHFTAGNDLGDLQLLHDAELVPGIEFLRILSKFSKPVVAAVEGMRLGSVLLCLSIAT